MNASCAVFSIFSIELKHTSHLNQYRHKTRVGILESLNNNLFTSTVQLQSTNVKYIHRVSKKSSTSYFPEYFRVGLTDCKNFNGYRVRDNLRSQVCNQCFNF